MNMNFPAIRAATESIRQSESTLLNAIEAINEGDIVDAAMLVNQAKIEAASGVAVAKAENKIMGTLLDIIA
ncbi:MAG: hypothetical protein NTY09_04495 [bacterium]|nr:hypothetical protein [bacterium]